MGNRKARFKKGDILYCRQFYAGSSCDCLVQVLSRKKAEKDPPEYPGYYTQPLSDNACKVIHDDCCTRFAIKVSNAFAEYFCLFRSS